MIRAWVGAVVATLVASTSEGRVWLVKPDGTGDAPDLRAAVASAEAYDVIELADGTFTGVGNRDIEVKKPLVFRSVSGDAASCIIDCEGRSRVFRLLDVVQIHDLTLAHGSVESPDPPDGLGGAVLAELQYPFPTLVTIDGCTFFENTAREGGALALYNPDFVSQEPGTEPCRISNSTFLGNRAENSGAVFVLYTNPTPQFVGCRFLLNEAAGNGGVVSLAAHTGIDFTDCFFDTNEALRGGVFEGGGYGNFTRCTLVRNRAVDGAHCSSDGSFNGGLTLIQCILASGKGGAAVQCPIDGFDLVQCTDIFDNQGGDWVECFDGRQAEDGNLCADPLFCDAKDYALTEGSRCSAENSPCGQMGAFGIGCSPSSAASSTWSVVKSRYR